MERKIQYYNDKPDKIWCYFIKGQMNPCNCGGNCFHYEYDGVKIIGVCNACKSDIYEMENKYTEEKLSTGIWK